MLSVARFHKQLHDASVDLVAALQSDLDVITVVSAAQQALPRIAQAHQVAVNAASRVFVSANEEVYLEMAAVAEQLFLGAQMIAECVIDAETFDVDQYQQGAYIVFDTFAAMGP